MNTSTFSYDSLHPPSGNEDFGASQLQLVPLEDRESWEHRPGLQSALLSHVVSRKTHQPLFHIPRLHLRAPTPILRSLE